MRILQLHTRYREPGGEDAVVRAEAELLRLAGHEVVVHHVQNPAGLFETITPVVRAAWNADAARTVRRLARQVRPDVAHVHNTWFALSPAIFPALQQASVPTVLTLHNYRLLCVNGLLFRDGRPCMDCVGTHPWHGVRHRCYRSSVSASAAVAGAITLHRVRGTWQRDVDAFVALTETARQVFLSGGLPPERVRVKPNFVTDPGPRLQAPSSSRTVLYVGRLAAGKGVDVLLRAWKAGAPAGLELKIIGEGAIRRELEVMAPPGVRFLGRLSPDEVRAVMLAARALVFPSVAQETFGLVLIEALACGLPVLASDLGGPREILGGAALFAPPDDVPALAAALESLSQDDLMEGLSVAGRESYEADYTAAGNLALLESIYNSVARPGS